MKPLDDHWWSLTKQRMWWLELVIGGALLFASVMAFLLRKSYFPLRFRSPPLAIGPCVLLFATAVALRFISGQDPFACRLRQSAVCGSYASLCVCVVLRLGRLSSRLASQQKLAHRSLGVARSLKTTQLAGYESWKYVSAFMAVAAGSAFPWLEIEAEAPGAQSCMRTAESIAFLVPLVGILVGYLGRFLWMNRSAKERVFLKPELVTLTIVALGAAIATMLITSLESVQLMVLISFLAATAISLATPTALTCAPLYNASNSLVDRDKMARLATHNLKIQDSAISLTNVLGNHPDQVVDTILEAIPPAARGEILGSDWAEQVLQVEVHHERKRSNEHAAPSLGPQPSHEGAEVLPTLTYSEPVSLASGPFREKRSSLAISTAKSISVLETILGSADQRVELFLFAQQELSVENLAFLESAFALSVSTLARLVRQRLFIQLEPCKVVDYRSASWEDAKRVADRLLAKPCRLAVSDEDLSILEQVSSVHSWEELFGALGIPERTSGEAVYDEEETRFEDSLGHIVDQFITSSSVNCLNIGGPCRKKVLKSLGQGRLGVGLLTLQPVVQVVWTLVERDTLVRFLYHQTKT
jgi:hypothetical protein